MPYTYDYPRPSVSTDTVLFRKYALNTQVLLIERGNEPFKGQWALPGGFLEMDETPEHCAIRELKEETAIEIRDVQLVGVFGEVDRDPRGRTIGVAYFTWLEDEQEPDAGSDAAGSQWFDIEKLPDLAFDHNKIIKKAMEVAGL